MKTDKHVAKLTGQLFETMYAVIMNEVVITFLQCSAVTYHVRWAMGILWLEIFCSVHLPKIVKIGTQ